MATPTEPANISYHSLEKSVCNLKDDGSDHGAQPEMPKEQEESSLKICNENEFKGDKTKKISSTSSEEAALQVATKDVTSSFIGKGSEAGDESGRERLKRHRMEMGGRVWIPETWGQENLLKNWIDCTSFDASLVNNSILSARAALMQQRATTRSNIDLTLHRRIQINRC
ncbi:hypothetical protein AgCh_013064 [Apium graveolens]